MTTYFEQQIDSMRDKMSSFESDMIHMRNELVAQTEEIKRLRQGSKLDHREILNIRLKMETIFTEVAQLEARA